MFLLESFCSVTLAFIADLRECSYKNILSGSREKLKLQYIVHTVLLRNVSLEITN
jgi:hypothetical protein